MGRLEEQDYDDKRLQRKQRRQRSQIIAYIILAVTIIVLLAVITTAVLFTRKTIVKIREEKAQSTEAAESATESSKIIIATPDETTVEVPEMTQNDILDEIVSSCISELSLEDKVAGLFIISPEQFTGVETVVKAGSSTQEALAEYAIGGLIYSSKNIKSEDQIAEMLKTTASMSKYPVFTAVTEEGTASSSITASLDSIGALEITDSDSAYNAGTTIASVLFKYGFNFDLAPTIDLSEEGLYGTDIDKVKDITAAMASGLNESGITACVPNFPVKADTLAGMASVEISSDELATTVYEVYKNAFVNGGVKAVMLSNVSLPQVTGDNTPVSVSKAMITDELRGVLGFDGVVITGSLSDKAITEYYTSDQAAVNAIKAGADMLYLPENFEEAYQGILSAVESGEITEDRLNESLSRIYRIKYADRVN